MISELGLALTHVTEQAALASYQWLGRGNKDKADEAAVKAMRNALNQCPVDATIVIGEGEIDNAPMLHIGERLGTGGTDIDIAVDPIEGTRMVAMGQANAIAVLAASEKGMLLQAPDMYMEKLIVGPEARDAINLGLPIEHNMAAIAKAMGKPLEELVVATLDKPRHQTFIREMQQLGVKVYAFPDGDVAASVLTCVEDSDVDVMYCIGGAPEGVVSAAVTRAMGGNMQARLLPRNVVKGDSEENRAMAKAELARCAHMQVRANTILTLDHLAKSSNIVFCATGITKGDLLQGVQQREGKLTTETLLIQGQSQKVRVIQSTHLIGSIT